MCSCNPPTYNPFPSAMPPLPEPTPMPTPMPTPLPRDPEPAPVGARSPEAAGVDPDTSMAVLRELGGIAGRVCTTTTSSDGLYRVTKCCTPAVGSKRVGVKARVCAEIARPIDPWGQHVPTDRPKGGGGWPQGPMPG